MKAKLIRIKMEELLTELAKIECVLLERECIEEEWLSGGVEWFHDRLEKEHLLGELKSLEWALTEEQLELDWERGNPPEEKIANAEDRAGEEESRCVGGQMGIRLAHLLTCSQREDSLKWRKKSS